MAIKLTDEQQQALESIIDHFDNEDLMVRQRQIAFWKKLEYFWAGIQRIYWNEVNHDWRVVNNESDITDSYYYDKPINIFKAFLETIVAAVGSIVPPVKAYPQDANVPLDVETARGASKVYELVSKQVHADLLFLRMWYIYCTQGLVAVYNYSHADEKYGTVPISEYEDVEEDQQVAYCSICKTSIQGQDKIIAENLDDQERDEFDPGDDDSESHSVLNDEKPGQLLCPNCLQQVDPEYRKEKVIVTRFNGITDEPKSQQCIEVYGGLFVKVPNYARTAQECPYLRLSYEQHFSKILEEFPKLNIEDVENAGGTDKPLERWGRLSTEYLGEYPLNTPTVNKYWLRPYTFNMIKDKDIREQIKKKFPDGAKVVLINDMFVDACNESFDDHWSLSRNPLSEYLHHDPLGATLVAVQEITNDIISLVLQTMEHGISQTFVETGLIDLQAYKETEATVGGIYPVRPRAGKPIEQSFYQLSTATLSKEVGPFGDKIYELGEFVSGAMPSLSGGAQQASSRTAAQQAMSRAQNLQRLQTPWKMMTTLWEEVWGNIFPSFIKDMLTDEVLVKEDNGSFLNVVIEKVKMEGKLGRVQIESSEQIPLSQGQIKDLIMNLIQVQNPEIMQALSLPENLPLIQKALGLNDFVLPAEADREKQYEEINILVKSKPVPAPNGQMQASLMPEPMVDNHAVEGEICRKWLVSESGREAKINNPDGYKNVLLHLKAHMDDLQMLHQTFPEQPQQPQKGAPAPPKPPAPSPANQ